MIVNDALDIGPRREDRGVDKALDIDRRCIVDDGFAVGAEFQKIFPFDDARTAGPGEKEPFRFVGMADADMAVSVDHVLMCQDTVGDDEVVQ